MGITKEEVRGLVLFVGRTAAGKDSAVRIFTNRFKDSQLGVSSTTRPRRSSELEDIDYRFISAEEFNRKNSKGRFLDAVSYNFIYNGELTRQSYGFDIKAHNYKKKIIFASMDLDRAIKIKEKLGSKALIVLVDAPLYVREERAKARDELFSLQEWRRRNHEEASRYKNAEGKVDWVLRNYDNFEGKDGLEYTIRLLFN